MEGISMSARLELLAAFRTSYSRFEAQVQLAVRESLGDPVVFERLGDDLDEFSVSVESNLFIFDGNEGSVLSINILILKSEVQAAYQQSMDMSHHGRPIIIQRVRQGRGRPKVVIDPDFLRMAYGHRGVTGIARYLGCSPTVVRQAVLDAGLAEPGSDPFPIPLPPGPSEPSNQISGVTNDNTVTYTTNNLPGSGSIVELQDPSESIPTIHSSTVVDNPLQQVPPTSVLSHWTDAELDDAVTRLRVHFPKAGLAMLDGMLKRLGHRVPRTRLRESLFRVDPVRRVFGRIIIQRRKYSVPGPNSLWHHDGQHGLIRWGIVIHGFIDGYSRLITGLRASNNNKARTVLDLFLQASGRYGVPSRLRGDHGVENIQVAAWMELHKGARRGSYIWGRSIHNVRIERLWVDVTTQFGSKWSEFFTNLEVCHGLDVHNPSHVWLLHYLFLEDINAEASFFSDAWNHHKIQMKHQASRSPLDMFLFDMHALGIRGEHLTTQELEMYGVDWEAIREDSVISSQLINNSSQEGTSSWVGRNGPPADLNEVAVEEPSLSLSTRDAQELLTYLSPLMGQGDANALSSRWIYGLAFARSRNSSF